MNPIDDRGHQDATPTPSLARVNLFEIVQIR
jgi:hypothetical protein